MVGRLCFICLLGILLIGCGENSAKTPPPTAVAVVSATSTPRPTETSTVMSSPTATSTDPLTNTPQPTNTATPNATATPTPTITSSPEPTEIPLEDDEKFIVTDGEVEILRQSEDSVIIVRDGVEYSFDYSEQVYAGISVLSAKILDTNNDGEREFLMNTYSNCGSWAGCEVTDILYFDPISRIYNRTLLDGRWPESDIDDDGKVEFRGKSYEFYHAGGYSLSDLHVVGFISPIEFYHFDSGVWKDVTSMFPERVASDAEDWLSDSIETNDCSYWGWAAYVADMYLLNRDNEGWQVYADYCGDKAGFEKRVEGLESTLLEMGYGD